MLRYNIYNSRHSSRILESSVSDEHGYSTSESYLEKMHNEANPDQTRVFKQVSTLKSIIQFLVQALEILDTFLH